MDKKAIEDLAISAVKNSITVCELLSPFINDNDKEPTWDGHVYIYRDKSKKKDGVRRIPVQVKGTEKDNLSKAEISFPVSTIELNSYLDDGGVVFFVVYIGHDGQHTQIYYASLTPIKIRILLHEAGGQASKSIKLNKFPSDKNKKEMIVINCWENCRRQASFAKANLYSIEELEQQGALESVTLSVTSVGGVDPQTALLTNEVYLYANIKGGVIPQPIEAIPERLMIQQERDARIMVGDQLYYTKVRVVRDGRTTQTLFGESFSITAQVESKAVKFNYKGTHKLRALTADLAFILALIDKKGFTYNEAFFPFDVDSADFSNFPREIMVERLVYLQKIVQLLNQFGCEKDIDLKSLQAEDWRNIDILIKSIIDNELVTGLKSDLPPVLTMEVGDLRFVVCLFKEDKRNDAYRISDFFTTELLYVYENKEGEKLTTSQFYCLRAKDFLEVDNIRYDVLLSSFQKTERNSETMIRANYFLLELLSAYDVNPQQKVLDTASDFSEWIMTAQEEELPLSIRTINELQIKKRQRKLTEEEKKKLYRLIETPDIGEEIVVGAYLLLGQQTAAEVHFEKMPAALQNEFKQFPIYHFWNNEGDHNGQA